MSVQKKKIHGSLKATNIEVINNLYDCYAGALYGLILKDVSAVDQANDILFEVFIQFNKDLMVSVEVKEGLFITLIRITKKLIDKKIH